MKVLFQLACFLTFLSAFEAASYNENSIGQYVRQSPTLASEETSNGDVYDRYTNEFPNEDANIINVGNNGLDIQLNEFEDEEPNFDPKKTPHSIEHTNHINNLLTDYTNQLNLLKNPENSDSKPQNQNVYKTFLVNFLNHLDSEVKKTGFIEYLKTHLPDMKQNLKNNPDFKKNLKSSLLQWLDLYKNNMNNDEANENTKTTRKESKLVRKLHKTIKSSMKSLAKEGKRQKRKEAREARKNKNQNKERNERKLEMKLKRQLKNVKKEFTKIESKMTKFLKRIGERFVKEDDIYENIISQLDKADALDDVYDLHNEIEDLKENIMNAL